ncbi:unnamed protein product [Cuscuta epithymum]|uniref:Uncharacterized protein n=1 Tax=Cuscuta epithymum TaxID=186058 RepID=A0AAV0E0K8_9ASTE|nr:unnamed protein product [Cuscuta epithymum]
MATSGTESDPHESKRRKTLQTPLPPFGAGKGKSKIENLESEDGDESELCCGICLLEAGNGRPIIQGCIDSCEHFFCFLCIMEWSKVESRCPMCKRRFSTIRRPADPPLFLSERLVSVPCRDQVYHHFGNVTTGPSDPYADAQCNVCHKSDNECLLLLCDLCDSASHTYCVGLGSNVPDGDWFCSDCTILRTEHAKTDTRDDSGTQLKQPDTSCHQISPMGECVSIFDIVREPNTRYVEGLSLVKSDPNRSSPQTVTTERDDELASSRSNKLSAKTLWRCRNVHDRIRTLRENWDGLQSGSMCFPSSKNHDCGSNGPQRSDEIDKAWKMMGIAKSMMNKHDETKTLTQASKHAHKNIVTHIEAKVEHVEKISTFSISSSHSHSLMRPAQSVPSIPSEEKLCLYSSRNNNAGTLKEEVGIEKVDERRKARDRYEAKKEVQCLVKLNLKLLSRDKKLEADKFKEIARLSTHSILEACGLEARCPGIPSFPNSNVCIHVEDGREIRRSTLMPKSCRECFYLFVKDVVNTILSERKG